MQKVNGSGHCNLFQEKRTLASSGYTDGSSGCCFLTSACVQFLGKPDDCYELTTLRRFRDEYLKKSADGAALVNEYYAIAPKIVEKIDASPLREEYYQKIYKAILVCISHIESGNNAGALSVYKNMVELLQKELVEAL